MNISAQKYKIWVNTAWLVFLTKKEYDELNLQIPLHIYLVEPKTKVILEHIEKLQSGIITMPVLVVTGSKSKSWSKLYNKMKIVFAAGGLIQNQDGKYLFFYRRGSWDLPKGKLDEHENNKAAALREVKEEVGLDCKILSPLSTTFHTYYEKNGKSVLKETAWFKMKAIHNTVKLQYEEDIEKYKWIHPKDFRKIEKKMYPNLLMLLNEIDFDTFNLKNESKSLAKSNKNRLNKAMVDSENRKYRKMKEIR